MTSKETYDKLEKAIFHYWAIGEVLIDISKGYNISEDIALKKIKEYMRIADVFTHRDLRTIKKDLGVLAILKRHSTRLDDEDWDSNIFNGIDYEYLDEEERKVVKEWLENE